MNTDFIDFMK